MITETAYQYIRGTNMQPVSDKEFTQWVTDHADDLFRYALRRCSSSDLSKDLVQETFLAAWRTRQNFRRDASARTWLFTILKSKLIDHYRKLSSDLKIEELNTPSDDYFFDEAGHWREHAYPKFWNEDALASVNKKDFLTVLSKCRNKLQPIQGMVFVMKYLDDFNSDSICKQLGISTSNYWVLIHRAKVRLRACIEKNWIN